jgi:hypothetical protein
MRYRAPINIYDMTELKIRIKIYHAYSPSVYLLTPSAVYDQDMNL